jgi:resuscitation-promoting factor RpfA
MTHNTKVRPAMAAIAAVIALSSPSFAQSVDEPISVPSAPAIEVAPALLAADPLAPEAAAKPAVRKAATAESTATRAASAAPKIATSGATISDPDAGAPIEPLASQPVVAPVQAPIAEPTVTADTNMNGAMIPIAGIGALGILALGAAGLIVRRRRRRAEDAEITARQQLAGTATDEDGVLVVEPEPEPEPATPAETAAVAAAVEAAHEPSPEIDGPVTELPEGFDVSQFGLHAQAAYNGPTEDNPSLSLKQRLRRASGMDQLAEREAEAEVAADAVEAPAANPAPVEKKPTLLPA